MKPGYYVGQSHVWKYSVPLQYTLQGPLPSGSQSFPARRLPAFQMSPPSVWGTWKTHRRPSSEPFLWESAPHDRWRWRMECQWVPSWVSQPGAGHVCKAACGAELWGTEHSSEKARTCSGSVNVPKPMLASSSLQSSFPSSQTFGFFLLSGRWYGLSAPPETTAHGRGRMPYFHILPLHREG